MPVAFDDDTGPVPWLSGCAWARRGEAARYEGLGLPEGTLPDDVDPLVVTADRRVRAPKLVVARALRTSDALDEAAQRAALAAFWNPAPWPVCCANLATLVLVNPTRGELGYVEEQVGVNLFHCRRCGALYGVPSGA